MVTIQAMPNPAHMPNESPHTCFSNGAATLPPPPAARTAMGAWCH